MLENYNKNRYKDQKSGNQEVDWLFAITSCEAPEADEDVAWGEISRKISNKSSRKNIKITAYLRIAASLTLIAVSFFVFKGYVFDSPELVVQQSTDTKSQVSFPDGSKAMLNVNSKVEFLEEFEDIREVQFSGEAYFDIVKNEKPFVIKMGDVRVLVLGTAFNLIKEKNEIKVLVDHGIVALENGSEQVKVSKGELGTFNSQTLQLSVDTTPSANIMSWRNGKFNFQETSLDKATKELAEYYNVTFNLSDAVKNCKITAKFDSIELKEVISVLETILGVSIERENSIIEIKGKGCQ